MVKNLLKIFLVIALIFALPFAAGAESNNVQHKEKNKSFQENQETTMVWTPSNSSSEGSGEIGTQSTSTFPGGVSKLYWMDDSQSLWWYIKPSYLKSYVYDLTITIYNSDTGEIEDTIDIYGSSLPGEESDLEAVYLPKGSYYAYLQGTALHSDGSITTVVPPSTAFKIN